MNENTILILSINQVEINKDLVLFYSKKFERIIETRLEESKTSKLFLIFHKSVKKEAVEIVGSALESHPRITPIKVILGSLKTFLQDHFKGHEGSLLVMIVDEGHENLLELQLHLKEGGVQSQSIQIERYYDHTTIRK